MGLAQDMFLNEEDKVILRIRIEIVRPGLVVDHRPIARLKLVSRQGYSYHDVGKYTVNCSSDVIDFGIEPQNLAHKKPD